MRELKNLQEAIKDMHPGTERERFEAERAKFEGIIKVHEATHEIKDKIISSLRDERNNLRLENIMLRSENETLKATLRIQEQNASRTE